MNDLFQALFSDKSLGFDSMDPKRLNDAINKSDKGRTGSTALYGGIDLFEGKLPTNAGDPNSDETMNDLREGGAGGPAGGAGAPAGGRAGEMGDPKVEEEKVEEGSKPEGIHDGDGTKVAGVATVPGGKRVNQAVTAEQGDVKVSNIVHSKGTVAEGTAGVAKTPKDKKIAGIEMGTGDVKVGAVVKGLKEEVGDEKVLGEFSDENTAKALQSKTQDSQISNYKNKEGKDVWKVTMMSKPGMSGMAESLVTKAFAAYQSAVVECRKQIKEEKDPLNAGLVALKNTIQNMLNFHSAGDTKQAVEYANLATKQAADIGANLQTMASAEEAAAGVHGQMGAAAGEEMVPGADMPAGDVAPMGDGAVSDDAAATADSIPTGDNEEMPVADEMPMDNEEEMEVPEDDVDVPENEESAAYEGKLPKNAGDPNSDATMNDLRESKIQECAEKAYLVIKLKERKTLTEKEKAFIKSVEKKVISEAVRAKAKIVLEKMLGKK